MLDEKTSFVLVEWFSLRATEMYSCKSQVELWINTKRYFVCGQVFSKTGQ